MKRRNCAAALLGLLLILTQLAVVQATQLDNGATLVDKFPNLTEEPFSEYIEPAYSSEFDPVQIDKFTGEALSEETSEVGGNQIQINRQVMYDREKRAFLHTTQREQTYSNVASGMTTTETVWLLVPEGVPFLLYKDGILMEEEKYSDISEPGAYALISNEITENKEVMHFTIVAPVTGQLSRFQVPEGFAISSALCNGIKIPFERTYVDMENEGEYDISYRCPVTESMYLFRVTVDHTPPVLALAEVMEDGIAKGPVDISDLEEGAQIGIWLNNKLIPQEQILTRSGKYHLVVTDAAGNMTEYDFMIRGYFNTNSKILIFVILAACAGIGIYALYSRRHMRIR